MNNIVGVAFCGQKRECIVLMEYERISPLRTNIDAFHNKTGSMVSHCSPPGSAEKIE